MNRIAPIAALLLGAGAAGCTTMQGTVVSFATVAQVVNEIQCQIWREIAAANAQTLWSGYRAKMALTVTVTNGAYASAGVNAYLGGIIRIGPYVSGERNLVQIVEIPEVAFNIAELGALDCTTPPEFQIANMSGSGIFASLFAFANGNGGGGVGRISDTFSVETSFGLWRYGSVNVYSYGPFNFNFNGGRSTSDVHSAIIAFTRNTAGADARLNEVITEHRERAAEDNSSSSSGLA
jgi:hypothetical protein